VKEAETLGHLLIVGGGAAGLTAAGFAAKERPDLKITVLERGGRPARKVRITGKGRCNVTNNCTVEEFIRHVPENGRFLYGALSALTPQDTMELFEGLGVPLKTERGSRVFPCSDKAADIAEALVRFAREGGVLLKQGRGAALLMKDGVCRGVRTADGEELAADAVIVCTGGLSYPLTGSDGDGYRLAEQAGHTLIPPRPSLVPLISPARWCAEAQGLSLRNCRLTARDNRTGKTVFEDLGELLFTHFGLSGPLVLSASAHMRQMAPGRYTLLLDLKPGLTPEQLDVRLLRDLEENRNRDFANSLDKLLPRKLILPMVRLSEIPPDRKCHSVTREERARLAVLLKALPVPVDGFRPVEEAIVTSGGVSVKEVSPKTMESKRVPGLYFAGEVLDVDAYTGGYNLQIAFSTGAAAGRQAALSLD
jgi:predicted Rossmann fold flavoprotein